MDCGTVGPESMCFLRELRRRLKSATGEPVSFAYLLQRLSVAIQVGNMFAVLGTLPVTDIDETACMILLGVGGMLLLCIIIIIITIIIIIKKARLTYYHVPVGTTTFCLLLCQCGVLALASNS